MVLTSITTLSTRKCFFIQLVLSKIQNASKGQDIMGLGQKFRMLNRVLKNQVADNDLLKIDSSLRHLMDELLLDIILYGSDKYNDTVKKEILLHTISFIKNTKLFERPLLPH